MSLSSHPSVRAASAFLLTLALAACNTAAPGRLAVDGDDAPSRAYLHAHNVPAHGVALEGYCPVAYFAVNEPVRGRPEHAAVHSGITYHFVSADARDAFLADPQAYLPAYGGWCAFGMAVEDKFPVDPRNFEIVDGRLMLFLRNPGVDARALWLDGDEAALVTKANAHWEHVQG